MDSTHGKSKFNHQKYKNFSLCINKLQIITYQSNIDYKAKFHLKFDSAKEEAFRKDLFAKTDALIEKHNSDPKATFQMGHNQFSTMVYKYNINFRVSK